MKLRIATVVCGILLVAAPLHAFVVTWNGEGGPGNRDLLDGVNWVTAPGPSDNLIFPGVTNRLATLNSALYTAGDITFDNATDYSFSGTGSSTLVFGGDVTLVNTSVTFLSTLQLQLDAGIRTLTNDSNSAFELASVLGGAGTLVKGGEGTLTIHGANSYGGGTTVNQGTLVVDASSGFSGSISHVSADMIVGSVFGGVLNIQAGGTVFSDQGLVGNIVGDNGNVVVHGSGSAWNTAADLYVGNAGNGTLYLYDQGKLNVIAGSGTVHLSHLSTGTGHIYIGSDGATYFSGGIVNAASITTDAGPSGEITFGTTATAASAYYLTNTGTSGGTNVTIGGATIVSNDAGYNVIRGDNTYTGPTNIYGGTLVASGGGTGNPLGTTGTVTVASGGTLAVYNAFINNPLVLQSGSRLIGSTSSGGLINQATIGGGVTLSPGFGSDDPVNGPLGSLKFSDLTLSDGGTLEIKVKDVSGTLTNNSVTVASPATLTIDATSGNPFTLKLISLDGSYYPGALTGGVSPGVTASLGFLAFQNETGSLILGDNLVLDTSMFDTGIGLADYTLTQTGNIYYLNFTPVPEPSTYALMALGLVGTGFAAWRRKRRA